MTALHLLKVSPLMTVQDAGRHGALRYGISASGPMDKAAFVDAGKMLEGSGQAGFEISGGLTEFGVEQGGVHAAFCGGDFDLRINGEPAKWNAAHRLNSSDHVTISPGKWGNFGYIRFALEMVLPKVVGCVATNTIAGLGGIDGRCLRQGDVVKLASAAAPEQKRARAKSSGLFLAEEGPLRFVWGLHAELFSPQVRQAFVETEFLIGRRFDRMAFFLDDAEGVFSGQDQLSLVSDAVVPGDIQILGDGVPIVLMRDHQPTGGYPRIGTLITGDQDRLAQLRPGTAIRFSPVSVAHARQIAAGSV